MRPFIPVLTVFVQSSGNAKNDDMLFPDLLPSMLAYLCDESDVQAVSRARYCVVVSGIESFALTKG